ncbi:MAG: hypothetical protein JSW63_11360 [Ignavibacterium sp.]|nr:MAG: hypothetical protein JSW63_11360 [Ignavibacterium sp.]
MLADIRKIVLLAIISTIVYGFAHTAVIDEADNKPNFHFGEEYFSLNPDVKLVYESTFGETICTTWLEEDQYVQEFISDEFIMIQQLKLDTNKLCITYLEQQLDILYITAHSIVVNYNEPSQLVSIPVQKDIKSQWTGLEYVNDHPADSIVITSEYLGNETITSEAGEFDCIKLVFVIKKASGKVNNYYEWRAPDVGLVQLTAEVDQKGFVGLMTQILGYDEIVFRLKKIET